MDDIGKQIEAIKDELRKTPYHKGTEYHIGRLRSRLAKLRGRQQEQRKSGGGRGFAIPKHGDATVVLVGFPSVGKSTLLNRLTNAKSPIGEYQFTTVTVIPGMMEYKGAQIQIFDVPGLVAGASGGKGRGREVLSVVDAADLLLMITEIGRGRSDFNRMNKELKSFSVSAPTLYVVNKVDKARGTYCTCANGSSFYISAKTGEGLDGLRQQIWDKLGLVRVYLRTHRKKVDREQPLIMRRGDILASVLEKLGPEKSKGKNKARIWGPGAKHPGQVASFSIKVQDEMEVLFE